MPIAGSIKCPVLIQAGEDDELSPLEFSDELAARIRTPKKLVI
jgi:pimeloyl-ACP methyl ester carboxylesterase